MSKQVKVYLWKQLSFMRNVKRKRMNGRKIEAKYPHVTIRTGYFGAVIGTHLGEGALGLGWYTK